MNRKELIEDCRARLSDITLMLDWEDEGEEKFEEWLRSLNMFEPFPGLDPYIAYEKSRFPAELSVLLLGHAKQSDMRVQDQFFYFGELSSRLKMLFSMYTNINEALSRYDDSYQIFL